MWNKIKYIVLFASFCCFSLGLYSQETYPPEPTSDSEKRHQTGDCGQGNGGGGNGRVPPPVGLCLPINDYLMPLLIAGILFGGYKMRKMESASGTQAV